MATLKRFEDLKVWKEARVLNQKLFVMNLKNFTIFKMKSMEKI